MEPLAPEVQWFPRSRSFMFSEIWWLEIHGFPEILEVLLMALSSIIPEDSCPKSTE